MRHFVYVALAYFCCVSGAQNLPVKPAFEVATVKPTESDRLTDPRLSEAIVQFRRNAARPGIIPMMGPDRVHLTGWPLIDLVAAANNVYASQVSGPAWLSSQEYDIDAVLPNGAQAAAVNAMLKTLLEERFSLQEHVETQMKHGYALIVGRKGPKLISAEQPRDLTSLTAEELKKQSAQKFDAKVQHARELQEQGESVVGYSVQSWPSITLHDLARQLGRYADSPVVDETGIAGKFSIKIEILPNGDTSNGTVFNAVEKLGLTLSPRELSVQVVVIDQVSRTPTPN